MKNRVRVATNKARRFLFNSGELQKNKEKVIVHSKIEVWLKRQTSIIFYSHTKTPRIIRHGVKFLLSIQIS